MAARAHGDVFRPLPLEKKKEVKKEENNNNKKHKGAPRRSEYVLKVTACHSVFIVKLEGGGGERGWGGPAAHN